MKDKSRYHKTLHQQHYDRGQELLKAGIGHSRHLAKADETDTGDYITSYTTYKVYMEAIGHFEKWLAVKYPMATVMRRAKKYVPEFVRHMESRIETEGISPATVRTYAMGVNKFYGIRMGDLYYEPLPQFPREAIKRSRVSAVRDAHFSRVKNSELVEFEMATGLRRSELENLRGGDCLTREELQDAKRSGSAKVRALLHNRIRYRDDARIMNMIDDALLFDVKYYVFVANGKGGRARLSPIISVDEETVYNRIHTTKPNQRVWIRVSSSYDVHADRAKYAVRVYRTYARPIEEIPFEMIRIQKQSGEVVYRKKQSDVYCLRGEEKGKLDRRAMKLASKALGHNRISVVAKHYLYNL